MIEVHEFITLPYAPRVVWKLLSDPHVVVACLPGAVIEQENADGTFDGTMTVQFGPVKVSFRAHVILELDQSTMSGRVTAQGKDKQGTTKFSSTMNFKVEQQGESPGTAVPVDARVEIAGRLMSIVETGAKFLVKRLAAQFSEELSARCATSDLSELQR